MRGNCEKIMTSKTSKILRINQNAFKALYKGNMGLEALDTTGEQIVDSTAVLKDVLKSFSVKNW